MARPKVCTPAKVTVSGCAYLSLQMWSDGGAPNCVGFGVPVQGVAAVVLRVL